MKKQILNLEGVAVLTKEQQKMVSGGAPGTCNALLTNPQTGRQVLLADVSLGTVQEAISEGTAVGIRVQWCCDSCGSASWL